MIEQTLMIVYPRWSFFFALENICLRAYSSWISIHFLYLLQYIRKFRQGFLFYLHSQLHPPTLTLCNCIWFLKWSTTTCIRISFSSFLIPRFFYWFKKTSSTALLREILSWLWSPTHTDKSHFSFIIAVLLFLDSL